MSPDTSSPASSTSAELARLERQGWSSLEAESYEEAARVFAEVFARDSENIAAFQGTIAVYRKQREFEKAERLVAKALSIHANHPGILSEVAWLRIAQKRYADAILAFDKVLEVDHSDEGIFLWKTSVLRALRRFDEAERTLAQATTFFPDSLDVRNEYGWLMFHQKLYQESLESFQAVLKKNDANESALQGAIASLRMKACFSEAAATARDAIVRLPRSPGIRSEKGWLDLDRGDLDEAIDDFEKVLPLTPREPFSHINLASALVRRGGVGDLDRATVCCREARRLDPDLREPFGLLGVIAFRRGDMQEAEANFLRSIRVDAVTGQPSLPVADQVQGEGLRYADLGALYLQMGRFDEAIGWIEQAVTLNPDDAYARIQRGNYHLLNGEPAKAIREFRSAAAMDPRNPEPPKALAIALMESDRLGEAEAVLRKAIDRLDEPQRWELHLALCQTLTRLGDATVEARFYEEALAEVGKAIRIKPHDTKPYFHSGVVRYKLDDLRGALKDFDRCHRGDKHQYEAELNSKRIRYRLRQDPRSRVSGLEKVLLSLVLLAQSVGVWILRIQRPDALSQTTFGILVPILMGLLIVAIVLPSLTRLKMTGLEAELSEIKPKETLATGPKGDIGFGSISPKIG